MNPYGGSLDPKPFSPVVSVDTAHDVRRCGTCTFCGRLGKDLLEFEMAGFRHLAHGYCFVVKRGVKALAALPDGEIDKMKLYDFVALGWTIEDSQRIVAAARGPAQPGLR